MKGILLCSVLTLALWAADKPRIFLTESSTMQVTGNSVVGDTKGSLSLTGGTSPQNVEVMRAFTEQCSGVTITSNREKADYIVRFDHEGANPTTLFVRGNKVAVFDRKDDLVYSHSTRLLRSAVKGAWAAMAEHSRK